jgi:hypothetical protein
MLVVDCSSGRHAHLASAQAQPESKHLYYFVAIVEGVYQTSEMLRQAQHDGLTNK